MTVINKSSRRKIGLETLEERLALSSTVYNGDLYVFGTDAGDTIRVAYFSLSGQYLVTENGFTNTYYSASSIRTGGRVLMYGFGGDDTLHNDTGLATVAYGGDGNDYIRTSSLPGISNNDYLDGGNGEDTLNGYAGNDVLVAGNDFSKNYLNGGDDNDVLYGGFGTDYLNGGDGNDYLYGADGTDTLSGGDGNDYLYGDFGNDELYGGSGNDYLYGGSGNDKLYGGAGDDWLFGELGADTLYGDYESQWYNGPVGNDVLDGGSDADVDTLYDWLGKNYFRKDPAGRDSYIGIDSSRDRFYN